MVTAIPVANPMMLIAAEVLLFERLRQADLK